MSWIIIAFGKTCVCQCRSSKGFPWSSANTASDGLWSSLHLFGEHSVLLLSLGLLYLHPLLRFLSVQEDMMGKFKQEKTVTSQRKSHNLAEWPNLLESILRDFSLENPGIVFLLQGFGQRRRCIVRTSPVSHRLCSSPSNSSSVWLQHLSQSDKRCSSPEQSREMKIYCGIRFYLKIWLTSNYTWEHNETL